MKGNGIDNSLKTIVVIMVMCTAIQLACVEIESSLPYGVMREDKLSTYSQTEWDFVEPAIDLLMQMINLWAHISCVHFGH